MGWYLWKLHRHIVRVRLEEQKLPLSQKIAVFEIQGVKFSDNISIYFKRAFLDISKIGSVFSKTGFGLT